MTINSNTQLILESTSDSFNDQTGSPRITSKARPCDLRLAVIG